MSATDFDPFTRPRVGHLQEDLKAAGGDRYATGAGANGAAFSFGDFLDIVNPLQHLPIIGNIYRELTGDEIGGTARIIGGGLYGGPFGLVSAAFNQIFEDTLGQDMAETALAAVTGEEMGTAVDELQTAAATTGEPQTAVAANAAADTGADAGGGEIVFWNPVPGSAAAAAGRTPPAPAPEAATAATAAAARRAAPTGADAAAGEAGVLTGADALAAFAADLRRGASGLPPAPLQAGQLQGADLPTAATTAPQAPARVATQTSTQTAALARGGRPDSFMPVNPRDFAGPRPQTGPVRALAKESPLPPEPARTEPAPAKGVSNGGSGGAPTAPAATPEPKAAPVAPPSGAAGAFAAPPVSDADFAARMMHALQKYEAMSRTGS